MNKFDFSRFAFKDELSDTSEEKAESTEQPPTESVELKRKEIICEPDSNDGETKSIPKPAYYKRHRSETVNESGSDNETVQSTTRPNRDRAAKSKKKEFIVFSDEDDDTDESDEDVFKVVKSTRTGNRTTRNNGIKEKRPIRKANRFDEHDISLNFRPLRKVNKSITIGYDDDAPLSKPLKLISNKLSKMNTNETKSTNMSDDILDLINHDSNESSNDRKKRKLNT